MAINDAYLWAVPSDSNSDDARLRDPTTTGGPVDHPATIAVTLEGIAFTEAGTVVHFATTAVTLDGITVSTAGTIGHPATLSAALDGIAASINGTSWHPAIIAGVLGEIAISLAGVISGSVAPPTVYYQGGGSGYPVQRRSKRADESIAEWVNEIYADLTTPETQKEVRLEAARVVKSFSNTPKEKVPVAESVDWDALAEESARISALLALWERTAKLAEEDDEMMLIVMAGTI